MKKLILLLFIQFTLFKLNAQVKIGAPGNPDVNAVLELAGTTKGLLLPRITLTSTTSASPLSVHSAGMVVYNTATNADVTPGYYYNDGTHWNRIAYSSETWGLSGNSATNPANQFLGTSDATDFAIRTNNLERIRVSSAGSFNIGTNSLSSNVRIRIGGSASGPFAATLGINGSVTATANGQSLYSIYHEPIFSGSFTHASIMGTTTRLNFTGTTESLIGDNTEVRMFASGSNNGTTIGVKGFVSRTSAGSDGSFFGGQFSVVTDNPGSGSMGAIYAIYGATTIAGTGATTIDLAGTQLNSLDINNANASITGAYGIRNLVNLNAAITLNEVTGIFNTVRANSNGIYTTAYGSFTSMGTNGNQGLMVNAFANYLEPISATNNITNYRGIYVGNIGLTSGTRRVFEYDGTGTNDPVIINYDGSVQIGNTSPVTNAKLSITDGHLQSGQTTKPTIIASASMGTGATASLNDATDIAGIISLDFGSGAWSSGVQATITFNKIYANAPIVIITAASLGSALGFESQRPFVTSTTTGFTINFGLPSTSGNLMIFNYQVIETTNN